MTVGGVEEDFWGNVIWSPTDRLLALSRILDQCGKTKVSDFDIHVRVQENITELQVAMDDLVGVHVMTPADKLDHKEARFRLSKAPTATQQVHEGTVGTKFQSHIYIIVIFETFVELNDIRVG